MLASLINGMNKWPFNFTKKSLHKKTNRITQSLGGPNRRYCVRNGFFANLRKKLEYPLPPLVQRTLTCHHSTGGWPLKAIHVTTVQGGGLWTSRTFTHKTAKHVTTVRGGGVAFGQDRPLDKGGGGTICNGTYNLRRFRKIELFPGRSR